MLDFMSTSSGSCAILCCDGGSKRCTMARGWQELCLSWAMQSSCPGGTGGTVIHGGNESYFETCIGVHTV